MRPPIGSGICKSGCGGAVGDVKRLGNGRHRAESSRQLHSRIKTTPAPPAVKNWKIDQEEGARTTSGAPRGPHTTPAGSEAPRRPRGAMSTSPIVRGYQEKDAHKGEPKQLAIGETFSR